MKMNLVSTLDRESQQLIRSLDELPKAQRVFEGTCSAAEYAAFLEQTYHYVRWTHPLLARAGARLRELGKSPTVAAIFTRKAAEETGHERWALSDLRELGRDLRVIRRATPSIAVQAFVAWNRFTVETGSPAAHLGTAYVLEALSARRAATAVKNLLARSAIPRVDHAVAFLRGHGEADDHHLVELAEMLAVVTDPADREAIALSARMTRILYVGLFSSIAEPVTSAPRVMTSGARAP